MRQRCQSDPSHLPCEAILRGAVPPTVVFGSIVLLAALVALGCEQVVVTTVEAGRVDISPPTAFVKVTETTQLTGTVLSTEGQALSGRAIAWSSLDPDIATVDEAGMVLGLAPGLASIRATSEGAVGTASVTVTSGPAISAAPEEIDFTAVQNGATPGDRTVNITNGGDGTLNGLTASIAYAPGQPAGWLSASMSGTAPTTLVLSANHTGLALGTYDATVTLASAVASNSPRSLTVRLTVLAPQPAIALGTTATGFNAVQGGADPAQQNVGVTNAGGGTLTGLSASVAYTSGQPTGWLSATLGSASAPTTLTLRATTGTLPQGIYTADVQVSSPVAQNNPQTVNVTFTVGSAQPTIGVNPSTLSFTGPKGGANPATKTVQVTNTGAGSLAGLAISVTYPGGQPAGWVTTSLSGTSAPATITVGAITSALDAGTYTATIRVTSPSAMNSPQSIEVGFQVQAPQPAIGVNPNNASFSTTRLAGDPAPQQVAITNAGGGTLSGLTRTISYTAGEPTGWLTASLAASTAPTTLTLTARIGSLDAGTYNANVRITATGASNTPVDITATFTIAVAAPAAPGPATATAISDRRVDVSWSDQSSDESRFDVERSSNGLTGWTVVGSAGANQNTYADASGLAGSTTYYYRVSACNAVGCSPNLTAAAATTAPNAPSNLAATAAGSSQVALTWTDNSPDETGFPIERSSNGGQSWTAISTAAAGATSYTDGTAAAATTYRYRVRACRNTVCSRYSTEASATTPPNAPGAPTELSASAVSSSRIDLAWTAATGTVQQYYIERRNNTLLGTYAVVDSVTAGSLTYRSDGLSPAMSYSHRVQACNSGGCSGYSNEATTTTPAVALVNAPTNLDATATSATQVDLTWDHDGLLLGSRFEIERAPASAPTSFTTIETVGADARSYSDTELTSATTYYYRVRACTIVACSAWSNVASTTTSEPGTPTNVVAFATSASQVTVAWTAPGGQTSFQIRRRVDGKGQPTTITVSEPAATSYSDSGLSSMTRYTYEVRACGAQGECSSYSAQVEATTH